jgi:carboxypeptidase T
MLKVLLPFFFLSGTCFLEAQDFARASVLFNPTNQTELLKLGIEADHGVVIPGYMITTDLSYEEIKLLREKGITVKILIPDVEKWYITQNTSPQTAESNNESPCEMVQQNNTGFFPTPQNYAAGSMGGYPTYEEMLATLDKMRTLYPNLISTRAIVSDTILTHDGRPMWWIRISDNPDIAENEPEALYTALHHAREPIGLTQMLFYMWYLLENYETNPEIKYLVDNTQLCFIPCVNPDGYIYNQTTNPAGGGLWRKNRSQNTDGSLGVDLNRNYGYQWGIDNQGSSDLPYTSTFRGTGPFSEPETRMVRDFCRTHDFKVALNYHTFGNLMIYPWAYSDAAADPYFPFLADALIAKNKFRPGPPALTVGYPVNGSSDDWMFAEPGTFSFTPETGPGNFAFWPPADTIVGLNKVTVWSNLVTGWSLLQFATAQDISPPEITATQFTLPVEVKRYGLQNGTFSLTITPLTPLVTTVTPTAQVFSIPQMGIDTIWFAGEMASNALSGDLVDLEISIDNGAFILRDTIKKLFTAGPRISIFADNFNSNSNWQGGWNLTTEAFVSAANSLTDSPFEPYFNNASNETELTALITIPNEPFPKLTFHAKWSIEAGYDWLQIEAVDMNDNAYPLCGKYSHFGGSAQPAAMPLWDGSQPEWVEESIDLSDFKGQEIKIRCSLKSDSELVLDGFYIDDVVISYIDTTTSSAHAGLGKAHLFSMQPNPAKEATTIKWENQSNKERRTVEIVNVFGQFVLRQELPAQTSGSLRFHTANWSSGTYTWFIQTDKGRSEGGKLIIE